jgi:ABC-type transport system substrate-binding protein
LFEQAALLPDSPDRTELYKKMAKISMEEAPWIFGTHRLSYSLKHNWLKNSKPHPITNHNVKYFRIDHKAKAEYLPKLK